ncbi:MAG: SH3 domain-containing protein, partial [Clostridia bacterium]|nr:SH3 domain-containing protein [Clostridia bacterium]
AIADNVPVRMNPSIHAAPTQDVLMRNDVVYVFTQVYDDEGRPWHLIQYNNRYGYILAATARFMTGAEEREHISKMSTPAPTPVYTPQPVTPSTLSSYGTIKTNAVNLRSSASTSATRLRSLNAGALVLILGTSTGSDGHTWYKVDVQGTVGFIRGDYVNHMTISQYNDFIRNLQNQTPGGGGGGGGGGNVNVTIPSTPSHGTGGLADLIAIEEGWSNNIRDGLPDYSTASPVPEETAEPTETPDPFADPEDLFSTPPPALLTDEENSGGSPVLLLVLGVVLMGGAAGVYGYVQYQNSKRKAQAKSAAARAQAGPQGQRRAVTQPIPRDGGASTIVGNGGRVPPPGGAGNTGRTPPMGGTGRIPPVGGAAASQSQQRPQNGQPPARPQPGAQARPTGQQPQQNPYARPAQQPPQQRPDPNQPPRVPRAQNPQNPQNKPAPPPRPRDEDLDV